MNVIVVQEKAGAFAENKDTAATLRNTVVLPTLRAREDLMIDFSGVTGATQSFVHALISEAFREFGPEVLNHIVFKGCNADVSEIVQMVADYMQESL